MTEDEQLSELGRAVRHRRQVKESLACVEHKLDRFRSALEQTAFAIKTNSDFRFDEETDAFTVLAIAGVQGFEAEGHFPTREELASALKDRRHLRERMARLDELLSL